MKLGITLPIYNTSVAKLPPMATAAEDAGFDSVWSYEVYASPFTILSAAALATTNIGLGTGLAAATTRHPLQMANAIADVDELSGGRAILGMGAGSPVLTMGAGGRQSKPLTLMREYVDQVRQCWDMIDSGEGGSFAGEFYDSTLLPASMGPKRSLVRRRIPIYLGAIRPKMIEVAAEKADGVLGCFFTPSYHDDVVKPAMAAGAARGGRAVDDVDTILYLICSICDDREEAYRRARVHVGAYVAFPGFVDSVVQHHGLEQQQQELQEALLTRGPEAQAELVTDEMVDLLSVTGTPEEVREKVAVLAQRFPHILLHTPAVPPITEGAGREAFDAILDTFGRRSG